MNEKYRIVQYIRGGGIKSLNYAAFDSMEESEAFVNTRNQEESDGAYYYGIDPNGTIMTYDFLRDNGEKLESALEGTCFLHIYDRVEYVVLADNTVITRKEDNESIQGAVFPY